MTLAFQTTQAMTRDELSNRSVKAIVEAFFERLSRDHADIAKIGFDEAARLGALAAEEAIAAARWSQIVGERIDTTELTRSLGVTRQALSKRLASGSLLGLPGRNTTWYPTWQFDSLDSGRHTIRHEVREVIRAFRDVLGNEVNPLHIASWATTTQHEDLDGQTPADWIAEKRDPDQLRRAARRTAARLAQ